MTTEIKSTSNAFTSSSVLQSQAQLLEQNLDIKCRRYRLKSYSHVFVGQDAIPIIINLKLASNETEAIAFGNKLIELKLIEHVTNDHPFKKEHLFYRFTEHYHNSKEDSIQDPNQTVIVKYTESSTISINVYSTQFHSYHIKLHAYTK